MTPPLIQTGQIPDAVCPKCAGGLRVITKRKFTETTKHKQFIGCMNFPRCNHTAVITDAVREKMEAVARELEAMVVNF